MPLLQAFAAAGRRAVLGDKDRMTAVRRLPAVVARRGRAQRSAMKPWACSKTTGSVFVAK